MTDFDNLEAQIIAARRRGEQLAATEARAAHATYDPQTQELVLVLKDGRTLRFPVALLQGLAGAADADLLGVEVTPAGGGLHWEKLDADLSVPALVRGIYGTRAWMERLQAHEPEPEAAKATP